jgi:acylphosphatase
MARTAHVTIAGRVQGVGFRAWVEHQASSRSLQGWVRNRRDGRVEALFSGSADNVAAMLDACWTGPPHARVADVAVTERVRDPHLAGFAILPEG